MHSRRAPKSTSQLLAYAVLSHSIHKTYATPQSISGPTESFARTTNEKLKKMKKKYVFWQFLEHFWQENWWIGVCYLLNGCRETVILWYVAWNLGKVFMVFHHYTQANKLGDVFVPCFLKKVFGQLRSFWAVISMLSFSAHFFNVEGKHPIKTIKSDFFQASVPIDNVLRKTVSGKMTKLTILNVKCFIIKKVQTCRRKRLN